MFISVKEKSWKVLLTKGFILNDQVKGEQCENCKSISQILTTNFSNPNLFLYGCENSKCKHRLLRLDFDLEEIPQTLNSSIINKKNTHFIFAMNYQTLHYFQLFHYNLVVFPSCRREEFKLSSIISVLNHFSIIHIVRTEDLLFFSVSQTIKRILFLKFHFKQWFQFQFFSVWIHKSIETPDLLLWLIRVY